MDWFDVCLNSLLPTSCLVCHRPARTVANLCDTCLELLPRNETPCPRCARPYRGAKLCRRCLDQPPSFDRALCPFLYEGLASSLVIKAKFHGDIVAACTLGRILAAALRAETTRGARPTHLIPVPLHRERLRRRGYNQALELARPVAKALGLELLPQACTRRKRTVAQPSLSSAAARRRNVKGAFAVSAGVRELTHVAVLDDVVTTGATVEELTGALRRYGVSRVVVWGFARTELQ